MTTIADLTSQLREEIRRQYNICADIDIWIHRVPSENAHITHPVALQLSLAMARTFGDKAKVKDAHDGCIKIEMPFNERTYVYFLYGPEVS
jgi:hypothetical protein